MAHHRQQKRPALIQRRIATLETGSKAAAAANPNHNMLTDGGPAKAVWKWSVTVRELSGDYPRIAGGRVLPAAALQAVLYSPVQALYH
jgi:hypothetical protein